MLRLSKLFKFHVMPFHSMAMLPQKRDKVGLRLTRAANDVDNDPCAEAAKVEQRLWLHGNLRDNPGVLGLGHCARLEAHGDNLRWMLDAHHPSSALTSCAGPSAKPDPKLSAEQMLAIAGRLDLVNNIFDNGVHGSLRNTLVEVGGPFSIFWRNPTLKY